MSKKWSKEEVEKIKNLLREGLELQKVADIVGRTKKSIISKFEKRRLNIDIRALQSEALYYEDIKCKECGKLFNDLKSNNRKFCSRSCSVSFSNKNKKHSEKTKNKISSSIKGYIKENGNFGALIEENRCKNVVHKNGKYKSCPICKKEFYTVPSQDRIYCSLKCSNHDRRNGQKYCKSIGGYRENSTIRHRTKYKGFWMDSGSEREFAELLDENNIKWIKNTTEFFEYNDEDNNIRKYFPDFFLPEYNFWVEIKGRYYETEYLQNKLNAVGDNIELMYHDEIRIPKCIT